MAFQDVDKSCNHRIFMQVPINSVADLGLALRAVRRSSNVRLDDMAAISGVSKQFASDVELGKATAWCSSCWTKWV
jgi:hypothetical protein